MSYFLADGDVAGPLMLVIVVIGGHSFLTAVAVIAIIIGEFRIPADCSPNPNLGLRGLRSTVFQLASIVSLSLGGSFMPAGDSGSLEFACSRTLHWSNWFRGNSFFG